MKDRLTHAATVLASMFDRCFLRAKGCGLWPVAIAFVWGTAGVNAATQNGTLRMEVITAYNLVVDSNVETPATNGPSAAHMGVRIYNDGATALTDVYVKIGDLTDAATGAGTPGVFPSRVNPQGYTGTFALQMPSGTADAVRYIPRIEPGEYVAQYFFVTYPLKDTLGHAVTGSAPVVTDDLWLNYDIWASANDGVTTRRVDQTTKVTMRNEISAMANKIWPNTDGKVPNEYLDAIQAQLGWRPDVSIARTPGASVMEGIWYDLGNVGAGFDNNGDGIPDRNAWMQPVGDPAKFSALGARLVKCYGLVIIKLNDGTEQLIPFEDRLYFENIPGNNNGAVGLVYYEFIPLDLSKPRQLSPYQEVASGYDNEKFNADYGGSVGTVVDSTPAMVFTKSGSPAKVAVNTDVTYTLTTKNNETSGSTLKFGWPELALPLILQDSIPSGMTYVATSASPANTTTPSGSGLSFVVTWSTDGGVTWVTTEPAAASVTTIRWTLSGPLAAQQTVTATFMAKVNSNYAGSSVSNTGNLKKGPDDTFATSTTTTQVSGINTLGDFVWKDLNRNGVQDGGLETGINNIGVTLYFDANNNGTLETTDPVYATTTTANNGTRDGAYLFTELPDGKYIVVVDQTDTDLPAGYSLLDTTSGNVKVTAAIAVDLDSARTSTPAVNVLTADWPFIEALVVSKTITQTIYGEGELITYAINLENHAAAVPALVLPVQTAWAKTVTGNRTAQLAANAQGAPNSTYARLDYASNSDTLTTSGGLTYAAQSGSITKVELILYGYLNQALTDDTVEVLLNGTLFTTVPTATLNTLTGSSKEFAIDITAKNAGTWDWTKATALVAELKSAKVQGNDGSTYWIDGIGFRVTTAASGSGLGTYGPASMDPLPLTDTFDNTKLAFVSASVQPTSVSGGTITWANVGPLNPGIRDTIDVTFRALSTAATTTTVNTATSTGGMLVSGRPTNSSTGTAQTVTINPRGSIGDFVWWDLDGDGIFDTGEPGIPNVRVTLDNNTETRTDANGYYIFSGLVDGPYTVTVDTTTLPWTTFTQTKDPDATVNNASSVTITNSNDSLDRDFGYDSNASSVISGTIFMDNNGNGVQNAGENPIAGLTVTLSGGGLSTPLTTTTNSSGYYVFGNLTNIVTNYTVTVNPPLNTTNTLDPDGTKDSTTSVPVRSLGTLYPNYNFAYQPSGSLTLGDTLYYDWNGNGTQDAGENGIPNVDVKLYEDTNGDGIIDPANDAFIATSSTNASGVYGFSTLVAGHYIVVVDTTDADFPANVTQTQDYDGERDNKAIVAFSSSLATVDFGYQPSGTGAIGNLVWFDANNNGIKDSSESGVNGVTVQLYHTGQTPGTDTPYATTTTAGGGLYSFSNLPASTYTVYIPASNFTGSGVLASIALSSTTTTAADNYDNGIQSAIGQPVACAAFTLAAGATNNTKDFGFTGVGSIGDFVFFDSNGNGQQDFSETGIPSVTVKLFLDADANGVPDTPGTPVATTVTSSGGSNPVGFYRFDNVLPGTYYVLVDTSTLPQVGGNPIPQTADPDLDGVPVNPPTYVGDNADSLVVVTAGTNYSGADFGYKPSGAIGDFVWLDLNQNGVQDSGEPGINGVAIRVTNGTTTYDLSTDLNGNWSQILADGGWTVTVLASNFTAGGALENRAPTYDADGTITANTVSLTVTSGVVNLAAGNLGIDFGYKLNGSYSLAGTVAIHDTGVIGVADDVDDFYNDGVDMDAGPLDETELSGVEVLLYYAGKWVGSTYTDSDGHYSFSGLASGPYNVVIGTTAAPLNHSTLTTTTANNISGSTVSNTSTSVTQQVTINTSNVTHVDFMFNSTVNYDFGDLPASYGMTTLAQDGARHIIPSGTIPSGGSTLYLGAVPPDADVNGMPSATATGDDTNGVDDEDGVTPVSIATWTNGTAASNNGGKVTATVAGTRGSGWLVGWIDWNHDGTFLDAGEMVLSQAVTTGTSTLSFDIPAGAITSGSQSWLSRFRIFTSEPAYPLFSYTGEATDGEVEDYLFQKPVAGSIGDMVWNDANNDGLVGSSEVGLGGVLVTLSGTASATQTTSNGSQDVDGDGVIDPVGYYRFRGLAAGPYTVTVSTPPSGYNPSYDENGTGTANVTTLTLASNEQHLTADFGYTPILANIAGQVRYDTNSNGNPGDSDSGALAVKIQLWTDPNGDGNPADGVQVGETYTDASGNYLFTSVPTGNYVVVEINPAGAVSTYDVVGANDDRIPVTMTGSNVTGRDFLDAPPPLYAISGAVYADNNVTNNNIIDGGDTPIPSVTINLYFDRDGDGLVSAGDTLLGNTPTNSSGAYSITNLPAGNYVVQEVDPASVTSVWDAAGSPSDNQIAVALTNANVTARNFLDAGYLVNIAGNVYDDANGLLGTPVNTVDGTGTNASDTLYANLVDGSNNVVQAVAVAAGGSYSFGNVVRNSSYTVVLSTTQGSVGSPVAAALPTGYANTGENLGADTGSDGTPDGRLAVAVTTSSVSNANFGIHPSAISGYVYAGTTPIPGVHLTLYDSNGNPVEDPNRPGFPFTVETDASGFYIFSGVAPGSYQVREDQPVGYTSYIHGGDGGDLNIIGDVTARVVSAGQTNTENNFYETSNCPSDWATWIGQRVGQGASDNPDLDRYNNVAEYAFNLPYDSGAGNAWWIQPGTGGTLDGVFVRPVGSTTNVTYTLQYAAALASPPVWQDLSIATLLTEGKATAVTNGCTQTITLLDLETLTGDKPVVRIKVELDEVPSTDPDYTTYTEVEGWKETSLSSCKTYSSPFLRETAFTGTVGSVSDNTLTFAAPVGLTITQAGSYYLEVTGGTYAGHRFDVASASGYNVTLSAYDSEKPAAALFNTLTTVPNLANAPVVIRTHWTLGVMFPVGSFLPADTQTGSDLVQTFANGAWTNYWLKNGSPKKWVLVGDDTFADCANTVLPPGQGIFVVRRGASAVTMLAYGEVRANDFIRPLAIANNLVAGGFPLDQSAVGSQSRQMNLTESLPDQPNSFFGSRDFSTADSFFVWKADTPVGGNGYDTYFLLSKPTSVLKWVKAGDPSVANQDAAKVFYGDRSVFILRKNALPTYRIPCPWVP